MPSVQLSAGRVTACWFVLRTLDRLGGHASRQDVTSFASRSSLRSGGLPVRDGLTIAIEGRFVEADPQTSEISLTAAGNSALDLGPDDEPSAEARWLIITRLLLADPPAWVAYWQGSPTSLDLVLPPAERRALQGAGLFPATDDPSDLDGWAFWQALGRVPLMAERSAHLKRLGDAGESLSMEYEKARLRAEGHGDLSERVLWLAQQSDAYGFDILSFVGGTGPDAQRRLAVEVKATALPRSSEFRFFLSAHEWEVAESLGPRYVIHGWTNVKVGPPSAAEFAKPLLVQPAVLPGHLPTSPDCGQGCRWASAEVRLPI